MIKVMLDPMVKKQMFLAHSYADIVGGLNTLNCTDGDLQIHSLNVDSLYHSIEHHDLKHSIREARTHELYDKHTYWVRS